MVDNFYKSLKRSITLILKRSTTSFAALEVVLSRNIESIRDFGGDDQATSLELLVEKIERDVGDWRRLGSSDLTPSVDKELKRPTTQMQKAHMETQESTQGGIFGLEVFEGKKGRDW